MVSWLKTNKNDSWYKYLRTAALILILKHTMLLISISGVNIYNFIIMTIIHSIFIFNL